MGAVMYILQLEVVVEVKGFKYATKSYTYFLLFVEIYCAIGNNIHYSRKNKLKNAFSRNSKVYNDLLLLPIQLFHVNPRRFFF